MGAQIIPPDIEPWRWKPADEHSLPRDASEPNLRVIHPRVDDRLLVLVDHLEGKAATRQRPAMANQKLDFKTLAKMVNPIGMRSRHFHTGKVRPLVLFIFRGDINALFRATR